MHEDEHVGKGLEALTAADMTGAHNDDGSWPNQPLSIETGAPPPAGHLAKTEFGCCGLRRDHAGRKPSDAQ